MAPVTLSVVPTRHHVPDATAEMLCSSLVLARATIGDGEAEESREP